VLGSDALTEAAVRTINERIADNARRAKALDVLDDLTRAAGRRGGLS
jgi:hypothetical protein